MWLWQSFLGQVTEHLAQLKAQDCYLQCHHYCDVDGNEENREVHSFTHMRIPRARIVSIQCMLMAS